MGKSIKFELQFLCVLAAPQILHNTVAFECKSCSGGHLSPVRLSQVQWQQLLYQRAPASLSIPFESLSYVDVISYVPSV